MLAIITSKLPWKYRPAHSELLAAAESQAHYEVLESTIRRARYRPGCFVLLSGGFQESARYPHPPSTSQCVQSIHLCEWTCGALASILG